MEVPLFALANSSISEGWRERWISTVLLLVLKSFCVATGVCFLEVLDPVYPVISGVLKSKML